MLKRGRQRVYSCRFLTAKSRSRLHFGSTVVLEMCYAKERTTINEFIVVIISKAF